jgi:membrane-associated phospholipid phosphatase
MARRPLIAVALCVVLDAAIYLLATRVPALRAADRHTLEGFMGLWALPGAHYAGTITGLFDPLSYALLVLGVAVGGLLGGRPRAGLLAAGAMVAASATSQLLKPLLAYPRPLLGALDHGSWPSGHATNAMIFAIALGMIAPAGWRTLVGAFGGLLTLATVYSLLVLGSHYPSDVLGGLLVATAWGSLAIIPLRAELRLRAPVPAAAVFAGVVVLAIALAPGRAASYAAAHTTFVAGALTLAAAALVLSGSVPAPTAARSRRQQGSPSARG